MSVGMNRRRSVPCLWRDCRQRSPIIKIKNGTVQYEGPCRKCVLPGD